MAEVCYLLAVLVIVKTTGSTAIHFLKIAFGTAKIKLDAQVDVAVCARFTDVRTDWNYRKTSSLIR